MRMRHVGKGILGGIGGLGGLAEMGGVGCIVMVRRGRTMHRIAAAHRDGVHARGLILRSNIEPVCLAGETSAATDHASDSVCGSST